MMKITYIPAHEANKKPKIYHITCKIIKITLDADDVVKLTVKDYLTDVKLHLTLKLSDFRLTFDVLCTNIEKSKYWRIKCDDSNNVLKMTQERLDCVIF